MTIRPITDSDYDALCGWWKDWGWTPVEKDFLPDTGYVVENEGEMICAGYLYLTNSKVCWVDWIVSNKQIKEGRKEGLSLLVSGLTEAAKATGARYSYALIKHIGLTQTYLSLGYQEGDSYSKELIKDLWEQ